MLIYTVNIEIKVSISEKKEKNTNAILMNTSQHVMYIDQFKVQKLVVGEIMWGK